MIRILNALALVAMIGTATWAYSVKYETILVAEKLKKREAELRKERDAIQVLAAEWELLNRPARLAAIAKPEAGMQQLSARQVVNARDLPAAAPVKADALDTLLTGSIPPAPKPAPAAVVPGSKANAKVQPGKVQPGKVQAGKVQSSKMQPARAQPARDGRQAVAARSAAPLSLSPVPKTVPAPKTGATRVVPPKTGAPKAGAPTRLSPPASVGQASAPEPKRESGGLNALFKKILN